MDDRHSLREVAWVFLKLGSTAFGGPAAHVAMMRREAIVRRRWISEREFLDGFAATSLLPGPGSTQVAMYLAKRRAGRWGLVVGGACFILPAMAVVLVMAWAYVRYGATPAGAGLLYGVTPLVVSIVADAVVGLARTAVRAFLLAVVALAAAAGYFLSVNVLILLLGAGLLVMAVRNRGRLGVPGGILSLAGLPLLLEQRGSETEPDLHRLFVEFLRLGSVVFGSGYVLFAYLQRDLVAGLGWLGPRHVLDAIAVGQLTPGPVFTAATFVGYILRGVPGALLATVAIFLPSFVLIATLGGVIPRLRRSPWAAGALDGVNAAAVGVMAGVCWDLGRAAITDGLTAALAVAGFVVLRFRVNHAWLILAGGVVGLLHSLVA